MVNHFPFCFFFQIFIAYPNKRVIGHETDPEEKVLVTNLPLQNCKAAAHGVMNFEPLKSKVLLELGKQVKREIKRYSKDPSNVFKYRGNLEKLAEFTNESLLKDVEEKIPSLHTFVKASVQGWRKVKNPVNQEALIISSYLNLWMPISNFAYQINTILVFRGCKKEEVDCFHKLDLSSHSNTLRNMQKKAAASFDTSVNEWKIDTVNRHNKIKLLEEVINSRSEKDENAMEICTVDSPWMLFLNVRITVMQFTKLVRKCFHGTRMTSSKILTYSLYWIHLKEKRPKTSGTITIT